MPKYIVERAIPGASRLSPAEVHAVTNKSNAVLREMGPDVQWLETFITPDKLYCVYIAKGPELVREHAKRSGIPADVVNEVKAIADPTSAEAR